MVSLAFLVFALAGASAVDGGADEEKKHHRHHHHHNTSANRTVASGEEPSKASGFAEDSKGKEDSKEAKEDSKDAKEPSGEESKIVDKIKAIEQKIDSKAAADAKTGVQQGRLIVNGPLPTNFATVFADAVASATGCDSNAVHVVESHGVAPAAEAPALLQLNSDLLLKASEVEIVFEAPANVVNEVLKQAADDESKLVNGPLNLYLTEREESDEPEKAEAAAVAEPAPTGDDGPRVDVDTAMPFGELEPFGREDTAQELTDASIHESDAMVDQLERAEVAEEKRAVFRAITRLRGAAITSFDGIARSQTGNIDEYNHVHKWRKAHPLHHLADEESDVSKWAFPDNAD